MTDDLDRRLNPFRYDSDGNLTEAAKQQDSTLRLDSLPADPGGGPSGPPLHVTPALLRARANESDSVSHQFEQECMKPMKSSAEVGKGMKGFRSAGAFATLDSRWESEIRYVAVELMSKFAEDLRNSATHFTSTDSASASSFHN